MNRRQFFTHIGRAVLGVFAPHLPGPEGMVMGSDGKLRILGDVYIAGDLDVAGNVGADMLAAMKSVECPMGYGTFNKLYVYEGIRPLPK